LKVTDKNSMIRIRIRFQVPESEVRIRGSGPVPKCHGSAYYCFLFQTLWFLLWGALRCIKKSASHLVEKRVDAELDCAQRHCAKSACKALNTARALKQMRAVAGQHAHVLTGGSRTFELLPRTHLNTRKFLSFPQYITLNYRSSEKKMPQCKASQHKANPWRFIDLGAVVVSWQDV
jgi:hypothetical protein